MTLMEQWRIRLPLGAADEPAARAPREEVKSDISRALD